MVERWVGRMEDGQQPLVRGLDGSGSGSKPSSMGVPAFYGVGRIGSTCVFLHGWGLDHKAYKRCFPAWCGRVCTSTPRRCPVLAGDGRAGDHDDRVVLLRHRGGDIPRHRRCGGHRSSLWVIRSEVELPSSWPTTTRTTSAACRYSSTPWVVRHGSLTAAPPCAPWRSGARFGDGASISRPTCFPSAKLAAGPPRHPGRGSAQLDPRPAVVLARSGPREAGRSDRGARRPAPAALPVVVLWGQHDHLVTRASFEDYVLDVSGVIPMC